MNTIHRALVLSVRPRFARAILSGSKTAELRRQRVSAPPGTAVILYSSSPMMAVVGTARIGAVDALAPRQAWRRYRKGLGLTKAEFDAYLEGNTMACVHSCDTEQR
jgi:predicted transcriptional regulator